MSPCSFDLEIQSLDYELLIYTSQVSDLRLPVVLFSLPVRKDKSFVVTLMGRYTVKVFT